MHAAVIADRGKDAYLTNSEPVKAKADKHYACFRLPLQRMWLLLLGLAAPAKSMSKILRVHDESDFLGGQRLLAFRARIKPEIRFRQQSEKVGRRHAENRL